MASDRVLTRLVHGGEPKIPVAGAVNVPVFLTSTFRQGSYDDPGYGYARANNPTRESLENLVAELEHGVRGFGFASGMAATAAALSLLSAGDRVLVSRNVYGGTYDLLSRLLPNEGLTFKYVDTTDVDEVSRAFDEGAQGLFVETPGGLAFQVQRAAACGDGRGAPPSGTMRIA